MVDKTFNLLLIKLHNFNISKLSKTFAGGGTTRNNKTILVMAIHKILNRGQHIIQICFGHFIQPIDEDKEGLAPGWQILASSRDCVLTVLDLHRACGLSIILCNQAPIATISI